MRAALDPYVTSRRVCLCADGWRGVQPETLRRYCKVYGLHIRPSSTLYDIAVCAGRCGRARVRGPPRWVCAWCTRPEPSAALPAVRPQALRSHT